MSDTFRARQVLFEPGAGQDAVSVLEGSRFDAKVDDEVDVVGGANVGRLAFDLVEEHHLAAD